MKPQPHRNADTHPDTRRTPTGTCAAGEREMQATGLRTPPAVPHRRYPSLSDDGQPYFPRLRHESRASEESVTAARTSGENDRPEFMSVRAIALLAIVAIFAALVASA